MLHDMRSKDEQDKGDLNAMLEANYNRMSGGGTGVEENDVVSNDGPGPLNPA